MPRSRRAPTRRRSYRPYQTSRGNWVNAGVHVTDAVSGIAIPRFLAVPQRGGLVDGRWREGSRDLVDPIDRRFSSPPDNTVPGPFWRVFDGTSYLLTADEDERDETLEDDSDYWHLLGYCYPNGDEETGLTQLYRLYDSGASDYFFTTDTDERADALAGDYEEQTPSVGLYVFTAAAKNRRPVYRGTHSSGTHYYALTAQEITDLGASYTFDGAVFYLLNGRERTLT